MTANNDSQAHAGHRAWRPGMCVLLIVLILYNPFLLVNPVHGLSYRTLSRNRATVGASELQHFSPVQNQTVQPDLAAAHTRFIIISANQNIPRPDFRRENFTQPELTSSIWFRPPPAL